MLATAHAVNQVFFIFQEASTNQQSRYAWNCYDSSGTKRTKFITRHPGDWWASRSS